MKAKGPMRPKTDMEFKSFELKITTPPDEEGYFEGYAAVFGNRDLGGDIIEAGAFTKTLQENPSVPILWQHNSDEPIGVSVSMEQDAKGLKVRGQLTMEVQRAKETRALMQAGALKGLSIGYKAIQRTFENTADGLTRRLKEVKIREWSPAVFPMNQLAGIDAASVKGEHKWLGQYRATESVDCLLEMIACGADFLAQEVEEGDTADAATMQTVLTSLASLLNSEIADVAAGQEEGEDPDVIVWVEEMREPLETSIKTLQALLDREPVAATREIDGAVEDSAEPALATLRALADSLRN